MRRTGITRSADQPSGRGHSLIILALCCLSPLLVSMDATVVSVALPSVHVSLHADVSQLQWVVDGYVLALASFLMLAGSTADRLGRRRVFQTGLATFALGSLICSVAPSVEVLIAARIVQGVGGSMLNPAAMSILTDTFADRRQRSRALGLWGGVVGISMAVGPMVGGFLTAHVSWRAIFWPNVPISLAAVVLTMRYVPESRAGRARRTDAVGQALVILALVALVYGLIEAPGAGWLSAPIIAALVVAAAGVVILVRHERRCVDPFLDIRFFRSVPFTTATVTAVLGFSSLGSFLFVSAFYLQQVRGLSPAATGVWMLPMAAGTLIASLASGALLARFGARPSFVGAGLLMAIAGIDLARLSATPPAALVMSAYAVFGVGFGLLNAPITATAVAGMPSAQAGLAGGIASSSRQVGMAIGVALSGTLTGIGGPASAAAAFTRATDPLWWVVAASGVSVALLGWVSTGSWARSTAASVAPLTVDA